MQLRQKRQLFSDTVIRILECPGRATEYWLMLADWAITLGPRDADACSPFIYAYARRADEPEGAQCTR
jgi:hypothetical protein